MNRICFLAALVLPVTILTGCATPADVRGMSALATPQQIYASTPLRENIAVRDVSGGQDTNPVWTSQVGNDEFAQALTASLRGAGLLAPGKEAGRYTLTAHLEGIDVPLAGISLTASATVNYVLVERATGKTVLERRISLPYTAPFHSAFLAVTRGRLAGEGAMKANIGAFIEDLFAMPATASAVALQ